MNTVVSFYGMIFQNLFDCLTLLVPYRVFFSCQKLLAKHDTDRKAFVTLQNIVYQELKSNSHEARGSATDALLWLKRFFIYLLEAFVGVARG